jgi:hypothetical protein
MERRRQHERDQKDRGERRQHDAKLISAVPVLPRRARDGKEPAYMDVCVINEPFSSCGCLADLQCADGLGELVGGPGAGRAAETSGSGIDDLACGCSGGVGGAGLRELVYLRDHQLAEQFQGSENLVEPAPGLGGDGVGDGPVSRH